MSKIKRMLNFNIINPVLTRLMTQEGVYITYID
jgi:hypothetical protein